MKKLKYAFLFALASAFFIGCSKQTPITGAQGAQGVTGVQGGNLVHAEWLVPLNSTTMKEVNASLYFTGVQYLGYRKDTTYMVSGYVTKVPQIDTLKFPTWYKMPYVNVYTNTGDVIYCSVGADSVKIWYYNAGASNIPVDSNLICHIILVQ